MRWLPLLALVLLATGLRFFRIDAQSLYQSGCFRAVCAAVIEETDKTPAGEAKVTEQADQAMAWLKQAIAAGYKDAHHMQDDKDLDALRDRQGCGGGATALDLPLSEDE